MSQTGLKAGGLDLQGQIGLETMGISPSNLSCVLII